MLQKEKLKHTKALLALETEKEKVQMAQTEISVLKKQLEREKATFEKAYVAIFADVMNWMFVRLPIKLILIRP